MASRFRNVSVLLVDVGSSMQEPLPGTDGDKAAGKVTKAGMAVRLARGLVQQKLLFMPKHEVGVVFFGAAATSNDLQADGYANVVAARGSKVCAPDLAALQALDAQPPGGETSDAVNGLIVSMDMIMRLTGGLKCTKLVHIFTDSQSIQPGDVDLLSCLTQAEASGIRVHVTLVAASGMANWESLTQISSQVSLVPLPQVARDASMCVKPVEQRCKVRMVMTISPDVQIPIGIYSKTVRAGLPTVKKRSKGAAGAAADPADAPSASAGSKDGVMIDRAYRLADDPEGEEVKKEDMIKGHKYGQSIVPMSEYDEAALMYTCERTLTALGFVRADAIGPEHSMQQVDVVAADLGNRWAHCAFESLVGAMVARDVVLVARYSFRKNAQPRCVALFPNRGPGGGAASLVMQYLPFEEDIREWVVASLPASSAVQRDAVSVLLDSMSLEEPAAGGLGAPGPDPAEALRLEDTHNPCLSRFYSFLTQRATDAAAKVPGPGPEMLSMLEPPAQIIERAGSSRVAELLKGAFAFEKVEKKVGKQKKFWREAIAQKRKGTDFGEVDVKRIRVDGIVKKDEDGEDKDIMKEEGSPGLFGAPEMAAPVDSAPPAPRLHIGTVNPVRDFEQWLAYRAGGVDTVGTAIQQMCSVIERLVEEGSDFYGKALSCVTALRKGCAEEGEAQAYNAFARKLRLECCESFGQAAREAKLGLITDAEVPTSTVSAEEARAFLAGEDHVSPAAPAVSGSAPAAAPAAPALSDKELEDMIG